MTKINNDRFDSLRLLEDLEIFFLESDPVFYPTFKQFAKAKVGWSLCWQACRYCNRREFMLFMNQENFLSMMQQLVTYPSIKVRFLSRLYIFSRTLYFYFVKIITFNYR